MARRATRDELERKILSKPGRHGTLYRFRIVYKQRGDDACPEFTWSTWAYDVEHAADRFNADDDDAWEIVSVERVRSTSL